MCILVFSFDAPFALVSGNSIQTCHAPSISFHPSYLDGHVSRMEAFHRLLVETEEWRGHRWCDHFSQRVHGGDPTTLGNHSFPFSGRLPSPQQQPLRPGEELFQEMATSRERIGSTPVHCRPYAFLDVGSSEKRDKR